MTAERVVIVGGGQAGARTAQALRAQGWQDEIVLLGAEPFCPYERPPLSKEVLTQAADPLKQTVLSEEKARDLDVQMRLETTVSKLDAIGKRVILDSGEAITFSRAVLATGMAPRQLASPGLEQFPSVLTLRNAADAMKLKPLLVNGASVVMIGGGFIGLEVAASAVANGCSVTVLEAEKQLMGRVVSPEVADTIAAIHRSHGVKIRTGVRAEAFEGLEDIRRVLLSNGTTIDADVVVMGVGGVPQDSLARRAGIHCAGGIVVNGASETSVPGIYAVGDVARHEELWGTPNVRLESWENAELQPKGAAAAIMGKAPDPRGAPWFWTDQYDNNLQILGFRGDAQTTIYRGDRSGRSWSSFALQDGRIVGALLMNDGRSRRAAKQLMDGGHVVDPAQLADPDVPLTAILKSAAPVRT